MALFNFRKSPNKYKLSAPFPWNESTSLVIYAAKSMEDNPNETFPSLIYNEYNPNQSTFVSDGAPYLTALTGKEMRDEIRDWIDQPFNRKDYQQALITKKWVLEQITAGWTHFLYETEPPEYAGNAYAWTKFAEKNK